MNSNLFKSINKKHILRSLILASAFLFNVHIYAQTVVPGNTYYDSTGYVEYIAGNLPFVISVPHGGYLKPTNIPDRDCSGCSYIKDSYTQELGREVQAAFYKITGCYPHIVINLLHRIKFDANRDIDNAADGNATVETSWREYNSFIDSSKARIISDYGQGIFFDLHGHGHTIQRIELGYLISKSELQSSDSVLNSSLIVAKSSIKSLVNNNITSLTHAELLRGNLSYGSILNGLGFAAIPSSSDPFPNGSESYFSGGYNTKRHGSKNGGLIDGIQMECNHDIRFDTILRKKFADSLAVAMINYYQAHYNNNFIGNYCGLISIKDNIKSIDINVYPNPSNGIINIKSSLKSMDIEVFNNLGQKVLSIKWSGASINISDLHSGLYYLNFINNGKSIGKRKVLKL